MLKILDKIIIVISVIAMLGLLGAYTSSYINPNTFIVPSLLGLGYPYLLIGNIVLLLYWVTRWKKMAWIVLTALLLGFPVFRSYYGTAGKQGEENTYDLSVLSYNIRYFDVYGWSNETHIKDKLFNYLNQFKGNIICLQEFSIAANSKNQQEVISHLKNFPYHYINKNMAIFSRVPLLQTGNMAFDPQSTASGIYCDLRVGKQTIRLYSIHLESYKLGKKERQFMKEISQGVTGNNLPDHLKSLFTRLTAANKNRAHQAEFVKEHMAKSPHPVILCGDFNDTPLSYTYKKIKEDLEDCFIEKGRGLGNTYIGEFPSFRIDYILHSPQFETISYSRDNVLLSDHYPIRSKLKLKK